MNQRPNSAIQQMNQRPLPIAAQNSSPKQQMNQRPLLKAAQIISPSQYLVDLEFWCLLKWMPPAWWVDAFDGMAAGPFGYCDPKAGSDVALCRIGLQFWTVDHVLAGLLIVGGEGNIMLPARCSSAAIVVFAGTDVAKPCWSCWNAMLAAVVWICGISADERMSPCDDEASAGLVRTDAVAATPGF
ncbi:hypothetical protein Nepgr_021045 [Nepenthes gracilis]|uniref:Uncharacterized protein n=1 Tax=Nepenthes gracilis TaxID=150966 RepID=A0AAD3SYU4_NEPGR|nr:hypothetical protein Nepgr_021045 [Nepenthes gracilis]